METEQQTKYCSQTGLTPQEVHEKLMAMADESIAKRGYKLNLYEIGEELKKIWDL